MKRLLAIAVTLLAVPLATTASAQAAVPYGGAPGVSHIRDDYPYECIALADHGSGRPAAGAPCADARSQRWAYRQPRIVSASGLCLTATSAGGVTTARCGRHGQRWNRIDPLSSIRFAWRLQSQLYAGYCLALSPAIASPVQLDPCNGPPVKDGGTEFWVFGL